MTAALGDRFNLIRFVTAQADSVYDTALAEIQAGRKRSHWMWFVFPQLVGLGHSETAKLYAIQDLDEARAYLTHAILGPRLRECVAAILALKGRTAHDIFGSPDDMKLHSSLTLFAQIAEPSSCFAQALEKYFAGRRDAATLRLLGTPDE